MQFCIAARQVVSSHFLLIFRYVMYRSGIMCVFDLLQSHLGLSSCCSRSKKRLVIKNMKAPGIEIYIYVCACMYVKAGRKTIYAY